MRRGRGAALTLTCLCLVFTATTAVTSARGDGRAVFVRGAELWIVNEDRSGLRQLTNDGQSKHHPVWSPDGSKIAYHSDFDSAGNAKIIVVGAARGELIKELPVPAASSAGATAINAILSLEWLSSDRIGYEGHINPSLSEYRIVRLMTGRIIKSMLVGGSKWSPDKKKLAAVGWLPHFDASETLHQFVQINGRTVYTLPKPRAVAYAASEFNWSPDSARVAFLERDETADKIKLVVLSAAGRSISSTLPKRVDVTRGVAWLDKQTLVLSGGEDIWAFNLARRRLTRLSPRMRRAYDKRMQAARAQEQLIASLGGSDASWRPTR